MNIPKEIIELALKGGWRADQRAQFIIYNDELEPGRRTQAQIGDHLALDPTFWVALGKACGWSEQEYYCTSGCGCAYPFGDGSHERDCVWKEEEFFWHKEAMRFYDLILQGKPTEEYWKELLTNQ